MSTGVLYYIVDDLRFVLDTLEASAAVDAAESKHTDKLRRIINNEAYIQIHLKIDSPLLGFEPGTSPVASLSANH